MGLIKKRLCVYIIFSLLVAAASIAYIAALASAAQDPCTGLSQDKLAHSMTALAKPSQGQTAIDPEFQTTIRRITAVSPSEGINAVIKPVRSTTQAWNADETKLLLWHKNRKHELYDGKTYQFIREVSISIASPEQVMWDPIDPDVFYFPSSVGNIPDLMRYRVSTNTVQKVTNFEGAPTSCPRDAGSLLSFGSIPQWMSWGADKIIGLQCGNTKFTYSITNDQIISVKTIISGNAPAAGPSGTSFYLDGKILNSSLKTDRTLDLTNPAAPASVGRDASGNDIYVSAAYSGSATGNVVSYKMSDGTRRVIVGESTGYPAPPAGTSISAAALNNPGWLAASIVGNTAGTGVLDQEIILANVDSGLVCRAGHHRSYAASGNWGASSDPSVVISPSGTRILFASDWGNGDSVDTYVIELPGYIASGVPDSTPPQISNGSPNGTLAIGVSSVNITVSTNEPANCRYSTSPAIAYSAMQNSFSTIGGISQVASVYGLASSQSFSYYVKCKDASNNANTDDYVVAFSTAFVDSSPPSQVVGLAAKAISSSQVYLNWSEATDNVGVAGYKIYIGGSLTGNTTARNYSATGLSAGTSYAFTVAAFDAAGNNGSQSSPVNVTTNGTAGGASEKKANILEPAAGSTLAGIVHARVSVSISGSVKKVELFLDDNSVLNWSQSPYEADLDTTEYPDGAYSMIAMATDSLNVTSSSDPVSVTIRNSASGGSTGGGFGGINYTAYNNTENNATENTSQQEIASIPVEELKNGISRMMQIGDEIKIVLPEGPLSLKLSGISQSTATFLFETEEVKLKVGETKNVGDRFSVTVSSISGKNISLILSSFSQTVASGKNETVTAAPVMPENNANAQTNSDALPADNSSDNSQEVFTEVSPPAKKGNAGLIIGIIVLVLGAAVGGGAFYYMQNKEKVMQKIEDIKNAASSGIAGPGQKQKSPLDNYIVQQKATGKSDMQIEKELVAGGWDKALVDEALLRNMK